MTPSALKPGEYIHLADEQAQIVWSQTFSILRDGYVDDICSLCLWLPKTNRYKTVEISYIRKKFKGGYLFSKEEIGADGM